LNKAVIFFMEIAMLVAMGYWGFSMHAGAAAWVWGVGTPLIAVIFWSIWAAPRSNRRLKMPYRALFTAVLFSLGAFLLYQAHQRAYAIIIFIVSIASTFIAFLSER
jgi:hypothetical protein